MNGPGSDDAKIDLNPPALEPAPDAPWRDDALQRQGIASELGSLVAQLAAGAESAAIALDGGYGTGKTFILRRWVQEMQDGGQVAVYYNAWENDCDDDPLVSLIETLALNETDWGERSAAALNEALTGILHKYTGVDAQKTRRAGRKRTAGLLKAAETRRESRQKLQKALTDLVDETRTKDTFGVVVVIDELDRCRPTFANELMERIKHVMNVPGLVFVFGVNVAALRETVRAVYGNIDAHQYLLRMFTLTLHMPPVVTSADHYLQRLSTRYGVLVFADKHGLGAVRDAIRLLTLVADAGGLTPRELDRVVWLLGKVTDASVYHDGSVGKIFPEVLVPLVIARVKDPRAYYEAVSRPNNAAVVINSVFGLISDIGHLDPRTFDKLEMAMYQICYQRPLADSDAGPPAYEALRRFADGRGQALDGQHLSDRSARVTKERAKQLLRAAPELSAFSFSDLQSITRRFDVVWHHSRGQ